ARFAAFAPGTPAVRPRRRERTMRVTTRRTDAARDRLSPRRVRTGAPAPAGGRRSSTTNPLLGAPMARGINKVILIGNLGADPETRYMPSGGAVTNIRLATSESWKDKTSGEQQERTEWHNVAMFGRLAEIAAEYLRKGSQVYIEGRLRTRKWQDRDGNDRWTTEVIANDMQMLGGRPGAGAPAQQAGDAAAHAGGAAPAADFDDDIPF